MTDGALGADWGGVVQAVANVSSNDGDSSVTVYGAVDAEAGFGPFAHFQGWELGDSSGGGYVSTTSILISDFGSADGCPQSLGVSSNTDCSGDWYLSSLYAAVWGWNPNIGNPEIYYNGCDGMANQPVQWANVSDYGAHHGDYGQVYFRGPLDQGSCLDSSQAWSDFQSALSSDGVTNSMSYSTHIQWG